MICFVFFQKGIPEVINLIGLLILLLLLLLGLNTFLEWMMKKPWKNDSNQFDNPSDEIDQNKLADFQDEENKNKTAQTDLFTSNI